MKTKKLLLVASMLLSVGSVMAQDVEDDFNVGPFEVYYKGQGDVSFRLKKDVDLYEYFDLKKDTIIQILEEKPEPLKHGVELNLFSETSMSRRARYSMVYGFEGVWKQRVANKTYFNGGLSFGFASTTIAKIKENILEIGVPLSVELANLNKKKASLYGQIGVTPAYYSTTSGKYIDAPEGAPGPQKFSGLYIAPCIELGGYIPVGKQIVKVGVNWRYRINCSPKDYDLYYIVVGQTFIGANIGLIF